MIKPIHEFYGDMSSPKRSTLLVLLKWQLSDAFDLHHHVNEAHWSMQGSWFLALHPVFDGVEHDISGYTDTLAQRIVALGGSTEGAVREIGQKRSSLQKACDSYESAFTLKLVAQHIKRTAGSIRGAVVEVRRLGDAGIASLLTDNSMRLTKAVEDLGAHLGTHAHGTRALTIPSNAHSWRAAS